MNDNTTWYKPAGTSPDPEWTVAIRPGDPGWNHTGLLVADLTAGQSREVRLEENEAIVVPLAGSLDVEIATASGNSHRIALAGRESVFHGPTDVVYAPRGARLRLLATGPVKVAVCLAVAGKTDEPLAVHRLPATEVPVELRGAGVASREVRNFGTPAVLEAEAMIACEVLTPAGNWSSYPPHKHDTHRPGVESELEEIYYFLMQPQPDAPSGAGAFGYQRVYGTAERPIDVLAEVRDDDVVLVPHGWHGPAMAPPGYHLYYLNVMAGPGEERAWLICDDPAHGWVRKDWENQEIDPRLPFSG
ncbi:MAG: 5-deoxy-glucuronate isomerase [Actinomycetales bacterium]